ncbi:MAG: DUF1015 domain-containing protein [Phycisphaerales bacterium]|nr:DUF1015 family protein [Phycisphaerae bacterium]NNF43378.1 DUF1015 domain-containing protein [Phycisphaerales bacterium]NNM25549.1 DUF1015 domain-containing protein [Phycisphaerales bacterium]
MLRIQPFRALRPPANLAARVASVPYDVVTTDQARDLAAGNPASFLHVVRPEIDLPPDTDPHDPAVYAQGRANLDRLRHEGCLVRDAEPRLFLYRQAQDHQTQVGIVACCHVEDYRRDLIKKHEKTRPDKENDRTRHLLALNAHAGPVFLTYRDSPSIDALVAEDRNQRPLYHFDAPDGVTHTVWEVRDPRAYVEAFGVVPCAYVADGHHRAASAFRAARERREHNPAHTGEEEYNWFLTVLFPASQLHILPYHRLVRDLGDRTPEAIRRELTRAGPLTETSTPQPERRGVFGIHLEGRWYRLELDPASIDTSDPVASLDAALVQERVLTPAFGIGDPRTDPRLDFLGGVHGIAGLERQVATGDAAAAIALHATSIEDLLRVADAAEMMPPKSTWFEPKLRSGLFVHELD